MNKQYSPDNYYAVLENLHTFINPKTYVEIGVRNGESFALAKTTTSSVAIDPEPNIEFDLPRGTQIFEMTSDAFFNKYNLNEVLQGNNLDLAFIDGMHLFEYALRDFINLEKYCNQNSVILVHDCYPIDEITSNRERTTKVWSGDVWKLIICLKKYRPELSVCCVDVPPTGLALITNLNRKSTTLSDHLQEAYDEFIPFEYSKIEDNKSYHFNRIENDAHQIQNFLRKSKPNLIKHLLSLFGGENGKNQIAG